MQVRNVELTSFRLHHQSRCRGRLDGHPANKARMSKRQRVSIDLGDALMKKQRVGEVSFAVDETQDDFKTPPTKKRPRTELGEYVEMLHDTPYPKARYRSRYGVKRSRLWENREEPMPYDSFDDEFMYQYQEWDDDDDKMDVRADRLPDRDGMVQQIEFRIPFGEKPALRSRSQHDTRKEVQNAEHGMNRCDGAIPEEAMPQ